MIDTPTFIKRRPMAPAASVDSDIRQILSNLKATANRDVFEVLAGATNTYLNAVIRFTGQGSLVAKDIDNLLTVWQIMLDVGKDRVDFTGGGQSSGPKSGPEEEEE